MHDEAMGTALNTVNDKGLDRNILYHIALTNKMAQQKVVTHAVPD